MTIDIKMPKLLTVDEVMNITKLTRVTLWRMEKKNKFPKHIVIADKAIRWFEDDVYNWLEGKRKEIKNDG